MDAVDDTAVVVAWRRRRGIAAVYYAIPFAVVLVYLAVSSMVFTPIHRGLFGLFAVVIAYFAAVQLLNTTRVSVRSGSLWVVHGPLPWRGGMEVPLAECRSLAVDRPGRRLQLRTRQGEEIDVLDGLPQAGSDELDAALRKLGVGR